MRFVKFFLLALFLVGIGAYYFVYVESTKATDYFIRHERDAAKLVRKEIVLKDGLHFVYLEGGRGDPLVLLHGFGANKDHFVRVAKFLTSHYHVIIPDLVGFGESSHPVPGDFGAVADYSIKAQAERVHAFVQAVGLKNIDLGGSSMGGAIAIAYAAAHPSEVDSLWLFSPSGVWSAPQSELAKIVEAQQHNPLLIRNADDYVHAFDFVMSKPPMVPRPILNVMAQETIKYKKLNEQIFNQISTDSIEQRAAGLKIPTLIIWGAQDRVLNPLTAEVLYKLMPQSKVIIMNGIGHLPMIEDPQQSAEDYLYFRFRIQAPE